MNIWTQNKKTLIPFNGARLCIKDPEHTEVIAWMPDIGRSEVIATYPTYDRAKGVFLEIIKAEENKESVYYMPAE